MRLHARTIVALGIAAGILCAPPFAAGSEGAEARAIRVLVVTGGHSFDPEPFSGLWDSVPGITWTHREHPDANAVYEADGAFPYDVVVLYDMVQEITATQREALDRRLNAGKFGLVILHHAMANYLDWAEYRAIMGGRYFIEARDGHAKSTYRHDQRMRLTPATPDHPVLAGVGEFEIVDEVYGGYLVDDGTTPLLTTTHPESEPVAAWAHAYGKGRVVTIQPGHGPHAFADANYRRLAGNAVHWAAPADEPETAEAGGGEE